MDQIIDRIKDLKYVIGAMVIGALIPVNEHLTLSLKSAKIVITSSLLFGGLGFVFYLIDKWRENKN